MAIRRNGCHRAIEAHSGLSARLACGAVGNRGRSRFDLLWASSLGASAVRGLPDAELYLIDGRLASIAAIVDASTLPVIVDLDTGSSPFAVEHYVPRLARLGAAAACIEDKAFPKLNSFLPSQQGLAPADEFCERLSAATVAAARSGREFQIVARVEALICGLGVTVALDRASRYVEAGADAILVHAREEPESLFEFAERFRRLDDRTPLLCILSAFPRLSCESAFARGYDAAIFSNHAIRASFKAMQRTFERILTEGAGSSCEPDLVSTKDLLDFLS